ncbi:helix-turn-helix domain-containing protein, partial [Prolixibacteraceae bacterium JC049]|nr:helix-turn-helix domain-containing protein [Prolixibacteraceae bacterium JC049]
KNAGVPSVPLSQPLECGTMGQDGTADNQPSKTD